MILFGLECLTTAIVLRELLAAGITVSLLCLPGPSSTLLLKTSRRRSLPLAIHPSDDQSVAGVAHTSGIPLWRIGQIDHPEVEAALHEVEADIVIVACYHRLIPASLYEDRAYGGINLHPSLLPDKRGPDPLFWIFKEDDPEVGATVHRMTARFDAGDILAQARIPKPDGISEAELDAALARLGSGLILDAIEALDSGRAIPQRQDETAATWARQPQESDFQLDRSRSARSALNFYTGMAGRGERFTVEMDGRLYAVHEVLGWSADQPRPATLPAGATYIKCSEGWLIAFLSEIE